MRARLAEEHRTFAKSHQQLLRNLIFDVKELPLLKITVPSDCEVFQPEVIRGWIELEFEAQNQFHFSLEQLRLAIPMLAAGQEHLDEPFMVTVLLFVGD